ncbi:hypothetical protein M885DRAFT_512236 [Pelagophyceae sp. CCMP2097]|nr:hypothetical protein M885DRAFT_512236 [Pelagophyceae sp. CCMP2097]
MAGCFGRPLGGPLERRERRGSSAASRRRREPRPSVPTGGFRRGPASERPTGAMHGRDGVCPQSLRGLWSGGERGVLSGSTKGTASAQKRGRQYAGGPRASPAPHPATCAKPNQNPRGGPRPQRPRCSLFARGENAGEEKPREAR